MKTFGEFFDAVVAWVQANSQVEAEFFLDEWREMVSEARWQEVRVMELTDGLFLNFAEDMANKFRERMQGISTDAMYRMTLESGHEFLRSIAHLGKVHGLVIAVEKVDVPLSFSDALVTNQQVPKQ